MIFMTPKQNCFARCLFLILHIPQISGPIFCRSGYSITNKRLKNNNNKKVPVKVSFNFFLKVISTISFQNQKKWAQILYAVTTRSFFEFSQAGEGRRCWENHVKPLSLSTARENL